ncbi:pre-mRNA-splicing factor ISY1 [Fistulifera solaris]|jgi:pre-mRNA-splicing factor ISY1|uniref:Pre-mRNA-splicing factor ISY1 n=1 Tax=Fistulifera solaris TaxID=1519565 RepID=A0A1Z5JE95_FISSO|nr:pre-mRNA-splicing factor ISY1 [Fistulifera solaris]|eukprot:GAX12340.1 pre-mRNA-splicing factor ISY1 [Fistulifera solaris]
MARPAEKARAMLNKWVAMREAGNVDPAMRRNRKRPNLASECEHLADAERFRSQIVREISDKIAKIQNPALGEHEIRELNDEINQKLREKWHWNKRIHELGGLDFNAIERKRQIEEGDTQLSGYRYFGAAKDLPGVKELLEKQKAKEQKRSIGDVYKRIPPDYYGWRDEEDGVLLKLEEIASRKLGAKKPRGDIDALIGDVDYIDVPTPDEIAAALLEYKKKALLEKYSL